MYLANDDIKNVSKIRQDSLSFCPSESVGGHAGMRAWHCIHLRRISTRFPRGTKTPTRTWNWFIYSSITVENL